MLEQQLDQPLVPEENRTVKRAIPFSAGIDVGAGINEQRRDFLVAVLNRQVERCAQRGGLCNRIRFRFTPGHHRDHLRVGVPGRIGNSGVGLIRPEIDVDARIDKHADRVHVPAARHDMQCSKPLAFDERVDTFLEQRCEDASIARIRGFEP